VAKDTESADASGDAIAVSKPDARAALAKPAKSGMSRATMIAIGVIMALLAAVAAYTFKK
jgi:hypothetical protein